jgi:hypothetical protein
MKVILRPEGVPLGNALGPSRAGEAQTLPTTLAAQSAAASAALVDAPARRAPGPV